MSLSKETKRAVKIAVVSITAYLINYVIKSILSVCTPQMISGEFFTKEIVGALSSTCFIFYACGQLFNGIIGDKVSSKNMLLIGFALSGAATLAVPILQNRAFLLVCFAFIGYGSSMLRGPLTKIISENTKIRQAQLICTLLNMSVFAGPLLASLLAMFFNWRTVFFSAGIISVLTSLIVYIYLSVCSGRGEIVFNKNTSSGFKGIFEIFKLDNFVFYMLISGISEIAGTSITFWIPTYLTERLKLSSETSSLVYSLTSFSTLFAPFLTLIIYDYLIRDGVKLSLIMYLLSAVCFLAVRIINVPIANIVMLLLAKFFASCAAGVVWSVYIPKLASSGKVSSANGVIDAFGYLMAAVANIVFSSSLKLFGWGGTINLWYFAMFAGAAISLYKAVKVKGAKLCK